MKSRIAFGNESVEAAFYALESSKTEEKELYKQLVKAFEKIEKDAFSGRQIPKKQIPGFYYERYNVENLWKYNLPKAWRLIYTIKQEEIEVVSIILEWLSHKEYERKFRY
ncbi:MAG TPA: hypothetical protein HA362_04110 [Nanoarchaeota archaeon]|nr:hypothetical protein [Nanoarchaeota archaeon]